MKILIFFVGWGWILLGLVSLSLQSSNLKVLVMSIIKRIRQFIISNNLKQEILKKIKIKK
jgi:hypothetical protein